jgi:hypothetical protein
MSDLILILSKCRKKISNVEFDSCKFHFKGYYLGKKVSEIVVIKCRKDQFEVGEDYLLWVKRNTFDSGILEVECLKSKKVI